VSGYVNTGAYTEASVLTASPGRLVVMLYDGAIRFLAQGAVAMRAGDRERMRDRLRRAEAIVDELNLILDMRYGEIPAQLSSLYLFCKRQIQEASIKVEPERVDHVVHLLTDLRESWEQIADRNEQTDVLEQGAA
jgi:flagellar secretion chaperone FliS